MLMKSGDKSFDMARDFTVDSKSRETVNSKLLEGEKSNTKLWWIIAAVVGSSIIIFLVAYGLGKERAILMMKMNNSKLKVSLALLGLSCLTNLFLIQPVSANMMQSKIGFTVHQDVRDAGVLPPEIPQNGQLVHYDLLPSTGSTQEYSLILFGCMLLLFVAVFSWLVCMERKENFNEKINIGFILLFSCYMLQALQFMPWTVTWKHSLHLVQRMIRIIAQVCKSQNLKHQHRIQIKLLSLKTEEIKHLKRQLQ